MANSEVPDSWQVAAADTANEPTILDDTSFSAGSTAAEDDLVSESTRMSDSRTVKGCRHCRPRFRLGTIAGGLVRYFHDLAASNEHLSCRKNGPATGTGYMLGPSVCNQQRAMFIDHKGDADQPFDLLQGPNLQAGCGLDSCAPRRRGGSSQDFGRTNIAVEATHGNFPANPKGGKRTREPL